MRFFWLILVALGLGTKRHWHILIAIVLGLVLGYFLHGPEFTPLQELFRVIGEIFIRLITMVVVPLVISSLIVGVSTLGDGKQLGRMGGKVLGWFLLLMVAGSVIGAVLAVTFEPGTTIDYTQLESIYETHKEKITVADLEEKHDLETIFLDMIPKNPFHALASLELIPVILFTLLFGAAVAFSGDAGRPIVSFFESVFTATMKLTEWIMALSVPGVFALTFYHVAKAGPDLLTAMAPYALLLVAGLLIQLLVIFPLLLWFVARLDPLSLYRAVSEALMVAFGTASSSATLPVTIASCERRAGISNRIASFVLPTGATINKSGTVVFLVMAVIFLAQAHNLPMDDVTVALVVIFAIVATIGTPGVPAGGLITVAIVIHGIGPEYNVLLPSVALLWPIDRVLDMCRTSVNVMSSCTVAALVGTSEGELNRDILTNHDAWGDVV